MQRSDLPHVSALPPESQRRAVDAMWRAYATAEKVDADPGRCPPAWVSTVVEMLEAALAALAPDSMTVRRGDPAATTLALNDRDEWQLVLDTRMPPGVALVGAPEQIERVLTDWTRSSFPDVPLEVKHGEVVALRVERPE